MTTGREDERLVVHTAWCAITFISVICIISLPYLLSGNPPATVDSYYYAQNVFNITEWPIMITRLSFLGACFALMLFIIFEKVCGDNLNAYLMVMLIFTTRLFLHMFINYDLASLTLAVGMFVPIYLIAYAVKNKNMSHSLLILTCVSCLIITATMMVFGLDGVTSLDIVNEQIGFSLENNSTLFSYLFDTGAFSFIFILVPILYAVYSSFINKVKINIHVIDTIFIGYFFYFSVFVLIMAKMKYIILFFLPILIITFGMAHIKNVRNILIFLLIINVAMLPFAYNFIPQEKMQVFDFINDNIAAGDVVMSHWSDGHWINYFTHAKAYDTPKNITYDYARYVMYSPCNVTLSFARDHNITYIVLDNRFWVNDNTMWAEAGYPDRASLYDGCFYNSMVFNSKITILDTMG